MIDPRKRGEAEGILEISYYGPEANNYSYLLPKRKALKELFPNESGLLANEQITGVTKLLNLIFDRGERRRGSWGFGND